MTENLRVALEAAPQTLRCACKSWAAFWCPNCDRPVCATCSTRGFHVVCRSLVRSLGSLRIQRREGQC